MYPQGRHPTPLQSGQPFKFSILEICDRIKEEFQFLQAQYHSLKLECEKLASEKTEMQRHYVMYYEMSYGLNIEMHKQAEIVKRLSGICAQIIPFLTQEVSGPCWGRGELEAWRRVAGSEWWALVPLGGPGGGGHWAGAGGFRDRGGWWLR
ncbi:transducin-like enhancer protein 2, partial [Enhydra lutris kenyoni]|uniref:Transducin-like enhancer protein 2 n=1 Tax=Enhydra lutris kenyoni TaxID=391180 RepID=A0A2Y9IIG1_ENHLU